MNRYFLDQDDDGHWYLVKCDKIAEWEDWLYDPEDDVPEDVAVRLNGGPSSVQFTDPISGPDVLSFS